MRSARRSPRRKPRATRSSVTPKPSPFSRLRGVFFGTSAFAVPALRAFAERVTCVLVVTQPDRPSGRGLRLQPTPVKIAARELGVTTIEPERLRDARETLAELDADVFALASYGKLVPQAILDLPPLGALNVHPSLLPRYRGAAPLQGQLRDGVVDGGVTIIAMDAGLDTGDIVAVEHAAIGPQETYGELHDRFADLGAELLGRACESLREGPLERTPQAGLIADSEIAATMTRPLRAADYDVDWTLPAARVLDLVRSLSPQPLARATFGDERVKLVAARHANAAVVAATAGLAPGAYATRGSDGFELAVRCGDGAVVIDRLIAPNRGALDGAAYAQRLAR